MSPFPGNAQVAIGWMEEVKNTVLTVFGCGRMTTRVKRLGRFCFKVGNPVRIHSAAPFIPVYRASARPIE